MEQNEKKKFFYYQYHSRETNSAQATICVHVEVWTEPTFQ